MHNEERLKFSPRAVAKLYELRDEFFARLKDIAETGRKNDLGTFDVHENRVNGECLGVPFELTARPVVMGEDRLPRALEFVVSTAHEKQPVHLDRGYVFLDKFLFAELERKNQIDYLDSDWSRLQGALLDRIALALLDSEIFKPSK